MIVFSRRGGGLVADDGTTMLEVTASSPKSIRVAIGAGELPERASWAVLPELWSREISVVHGGEGSFSTGALSVSVDPVTMALTVADADGTILCRDHPHDPVRLEKDGVRLRKQAPAGEFYYGLGDKPGPLEKRGQAYQMWNTDAYGFQEAWDPLYKTIPFLLAVRPGGLAWGLFLDSTFRSAFDLAVTSPDAIGLSAAGGDVRYHIFAGPRPKQVLERFTELVGRISLPPLWALGYQQCRYSYETAERALEVARLHREKSIPLDALWLDIGYQDRNRPFTAGAGFPALGDTVARLRSEGVATVVIADLHVPHAPGEQYAPYETGSSGGHFARMPDGSDYVGEVWPGDCVFPDFTRVATREWWGGLHRRFAVEFGIAGFWNDMNEPAVFKTDGHTMPPEVRHRIEEPGFETRTAGHAEIHNVYGMQNARATHDGLLALEPHRRPFVMTRASYAGGHRHAVTWTGDNSSTENHLRLSTPQLLGLGLSGFAMAGCDIGGFKGSPTPELLTRWIALGAFNPIMRNHTDLDTRDQEAWVDGAAHEALRRASIEARYRLLPYIYTCIEKTARTGMPLMRPMFLEFDDIALRREEAQFMFGDALLVAPPPVDGVGDYALTLPEGVDWFDYWTGAPVDAGAPVMLERRLGHVPVFARGGWIVPTQPVIQHTGERPSGKMTLNVYPGPDCAGSVYDDDGSSHGYREGEFFRQEFRWIDGALVCEPASGTWTPWWDGYEVVVHG